MDIDKKILLIALVLIGYQLMIYIMITFQISGLEREFEKTRDLIRRGWRNDK